jgi:hypothetical protein
MLETSLACLPSFGISTGQADEVELFKDSIQLDDGTGFGGSAFSSYRAELQKLTGCWREAQRAEIAAAKLLELRSTLADTDSITSLLREIETIPRLLRDLYDLFPIYVSRILIVLNYLDVILPALSAVSRSIIGKLDYSEVTTKVGWDSLLARLRIDEMSLHSELAMYKEFLVQLVRLFAR